MLNCPDEPLVLFPGDPVPVGVNPVTGAPIEYYIIKDQNDAERFNEAVRRAGAQCRSMVRSNCQFYKDAGSKVICQGLAVKEEEVAN